MRAERETEKAGAVTDRSSSLQRLVRRYLDFCCVGGAFGGGFGGGGLPLEPRDSLISVGLDGCGLVGSAMTKEQLREKVWKSLFLSDYCVRYWSFYEFWIGLVAGVMKAFLALSSVLSLVGLLLEEKYLFVAAIVGSLSGLLATVILPSFGWDTILERVIAVRNGWIDVRNGYQGIWDDIEDAPQGRLEKRLDTLEARDKELEQRSIRLPTIKKFQDKAYEESERLCA